MKTSLHADRHREQRLTRLYMDLTGTTESAARSVFMHICAEGAAVVKMPQPELRPRFTQRSVERRSPSIRSEQRSPSPVPALTLNQTPAQPAGL